MNSLHLLNDKYLQSTTNRCGSVSSLDTVIGYCRWAQRPACRTDEYNVYVRFPAWGSVHATDNHSGGEHARDADRDGVNEVHANSMEGL